MAKLYIAPPDIEELISYCVDWLALNLRAKVTITIDRHEKGKITLERDERPNM